ncbi:MAG: molybdopterin cofactor-binding domain-containing protein [Nitratireductor sp.]
MVRHVGDAVAFIVADSVAIARDAAELIEIDYEMLEAVADTEAALDQSSPKVYEDADSNIAFVTRTGDYAATDAAFARAAHVTELRIINNRLVSNYMEPRSCLAEWSNDEDRFSLIVCSQGVYGIRNMMMNVFGIEEKNIRVRTADVGGGFGTRVFSYREYPLAMEAARRIGKPVKWTCDRTEHFMVDAHGRDNIAVAKMAMDENGKISGDQDRSRRGNGCLSFAYGPYIPTLGISMTTRSTTSRQWRSTCAAFTLPAPVDAYRGAGRPEAAYLIERLVDQCALDMAMPRDEIRRVNFIRPEQMPHHARQANV